MANVLVERSYLEDIADSIRGKLGVADTYKPSEMSDAIDSISGGGITPTGTININSNGSHDVTQYATAAVNVPNSYSASDEGKVVNNGTLVSQTSDTVTENGTVDTTLINSLIVNVSGGGGGMETGSFTAGTNQSNVTIPVTALHSHILLWDDTVKGDADLTGAPYGTKKLLMLFADNTTGYMSVNGIASSGTGYAASFAGMGQWGNNTGVWNYRATFSASQIVITNPRINGTSHTWIENNKINWAAW